MKTIKIIKSYSSGSKILYVIVPENCSESIIKQYVEIECDKDLSGRSNGYSFVWEVETDIDVILGVIKNNLIFINHKIETLQYEKVDLHDYLNDINISQLDKNIC